MDIQDVYNFLKSNLDNEICSPNAKMKRIKLPIPEEFGGGYATGEGYIGAVRNLIERIKPQIIQQDKPSSPLFSECWEKWIEL